MCVWFSGVGALVCIDLGYSVKHQDSISLTMTKYPNASARGFLESAALTIPATDNNACRRRTRNENSCVCFFVNIHGSCLPNSSV